MKVEYLSSYDRSFRALPSHVQSHVITAIDRLLDALATRQRPLGLGLRRLRRPYWEVRAGIDIRVLFTLRKDYLTMIIVGHHEVIRRTLKHA